MCMFIVIGTGIFLAGANRPALAANWTPEERLSTDSGQVFTPQVATGPGNDAVVVWQHRPHPSSVDDVESTREHSGGSWVAPSILTEFSSNSGGPMVGVDGLGNAIATWASGPIGSQEAFLQSSELPFNGEWETIETFSERKRATYAYTVQSGVDAAGDTTAVWEQETNGQVATYVAERPTGGSWRSPTELSKNAFQPLVVVNPRGEALAVWMQSVEPGEYAIYASSRPAGGSWQTPVPISQEDQPAKQPVIAIAPDGEAVAAWLALEGKNFIVQAATKPLAGQWQPPVNLSEPGRNSLEPRIAIDAQGEAVAVWEHEQEAVEIVQYAVKPPGVEWSKAATLSEAPANLFNAQVAMNATGDTMAIWTLSNGDMRSSIFEHGMWSPATRVGGSEVAGGAVDLTISPTGHALAVWDQQIGETESAIYGARYSFAGPTPPTIRKISPRKFPAAGGIEVTVRGTGFEDVTSVEFGTRPATSFNVASPTELVAVAPPNTSGTAQLSVSTLGGTNTETTKSKITYSAPTVDAVSPSAGPPDGGMAAIEGTGFSPGSETTSFRFGKNAATDVECTSTTTCTMLVPPATKAMTVDVIASVGKSKSKKTPPADTYRYE
jgi:hypothetical protein